MITNLDGTQEKEIMLLSGHVKYSCNFVCSLGSKMIVPIKTAEHLGLCPMMMLKFKTSQLVQNSK